MVWFEGMGTGEGLQALWRAALGIFGACLAVLCLAGLLATSAWPRMHAGPVAMDGGRRLKGTTVADGMATSLSAAYSFRKVRSAYAGNAVKLRRTTGGTQDIGFTAAGDFDTAAAATFCASTTCFLDTWYDQSGNARSWLQATPANQPQYVADCGNALPCARSTATQKMVASGSVTPVMPVSLSVVAYRNVVSTGACYPVSMIDNFGNQIFIDANNSRWAIWDGSAFIVPPAGTAEAAWHVANGVINGAGSVLRIDGVETTGAITGNLSAGQFMGANNAGGPASCDMREAFVWNGYGLTAAERLALAENQRQYYTPLPLDTFATPAAAYSMRKLKSSYTGPAIRLRRASDNAEQDINFLSYTGFTGAPLDTVAAAAHCAATSCTIVTVYDQSGNTRHVTQATAGNQPALVFNCIGTLPCARSTGTQILLGPSTTATTGVISMAGVTLAEVVGQGCNNLQLAGGIFSFSTPIAGGDRWGSWNDGGLTSPTAAPPNQWRAGIIVINGASSVARVDAQETTGAMANLAKTGVIGTWLSAADNISPCRHTEAVYWDNYALTAGERAALQANQKSFWGTP